jgi:hypothetical protein
LAYERVHGDVITACNHSQGLNMMNNAVALEAKPLQVIEMLVENSLIAYIKETLIYM